MTRRREQGEMNKTQSFCVAIIRNGPWKGNTCGKSCKSNINLCTVHSRCASKPRRRNLTERLRCYKSLALRKRYYKVLINNKEKYKRSIRSC